MKSMPGFFLGTELEDFPRTPKGSKKWNPPNTNPLLHWGNQGIIRGFHCFGSFRGSGLRAGSEFSSRRLRSAMRLGTRSS